MRTVEECRHLPALGDALWWERHLVEHLLYKLVSATLLLASSDTRFVTRALGEVDVAAARVGDVERTRSGALARVASDWHVDPSELTLARLADQAPEPWRSMLGDHRDAFWGLARELEATAGREPRLAPTVRRWTRSSPGAVSLDLVT